MADFVSIAGLSIAVFDKIWIIGTTTAELISDYRHFDEVSCVYMWGSKLLSSSSLTG